MVIVPYSHAVTSSLSGGTANQRFEVLISISAEFVNTASACLGIAMACYIIIREWQHNGLILGGQMSGIAYFVQL